MCKKGIHVNVKNEEGRLTDLKIETNKKDGTKGIVGTFTGRGFNQGRVVSIDDVEPTNKKAQKLLVSELEALSTKISKKSRVSAKLCPA